MFEFLAVYCVERGHVYPAIETTVVLAIITLYCMYSSHIVVAGELLTGHIAIY